MGYDWATGSGMGARAMPKKWRKPALVVAAQLMCLSSAFAFEFDTGNDDLKIRWDNSVKYSAAFRTHKMSGGLTNPSVAPASPNQDDGDRNFSKRGLISNRIDLLSDLDVVFKGDYGARLSGAAWYDSVYNRDTHNDSAGVFGPSPPAPPNSYNASSGDPTKFTDNARKINGRKAEVLDAFLFGKGEIGDARWGGKVGRHTVLWGETLFFGENGIAGGQAPVDLVKLLSVPGSQFKEIIRPVGQVSGTLQITPNVLLGAYYQYRWEDSRLPPVSSYFSFQDIFADGQRFFDPFGGPPLNHVADYKPKDSGQGGVQVRFRLPEGQTDYGLYAIRYHAKIFSAAYLTPVGYRLDYHEGIRAFGASASRTFGDVNLATEVSIRDNAPLVTDPMGAFAPTAGNPLYPIGRTAHVNLSSIWTVPSTPLFNEALFLGELAWNRRLSVSNGDTVAANGGGFAANSTRDALGMRFIFTPTYRQVFSGLDVDVPIGVGYNPYGRSGAIALFNGGQTKGGDASIGLSGNYLNTLKLGLNYTRFFGSEGTALNGFGQLSYKQALHDRDFVSLSVQTTF